MPWICFIRCCRCCRRATTWSRGRSCSRRRYLSWLDFDEPEAVQAFVDRFEHSLEAIVAHYLNLQIEHQPEKKEKLVAIESLFDQSLHGLRKPECATRSAGSCADRGPGPGTVGEAADDEKSADSRRRRDQSIYASALRPRRRFYFGQNEQAAEVTGQVAGNSSSRICRRCRKRTWHVPMCLLWDKLRLKSPFH